MHIIPASLETWSNRYCSLLLVHTIHSPVHPKTKQNSNSRNKMNLPNLMQNEYWIRQFAFKRLLHCNSKQTPINIPPPQSIPFSVPLSIAVVSFTNNTNFKCQRECVGRSSINSEFDLVSHRVHTTYTERVTFGEFRLW